MIFFKPFSKRLVDHEVMGEVIVPWKALERTTEGTQLLKFGRMGSPHYLDFRVSSIEICLLRYVLTCFLIRDAD